MKLRNVIFVAMGVVFLLGLLLLIGFFSNIQLKLSDNLYGGKSALDAIVIIAIDDKSLQEIGRWPWERDVYVKILEKTSEAKAIGIDVAFFESSDKDDVLAEAISKNNKVVLSSEFISFKKVDGKLKGDKLLKPVQELETETGYANIITDNDGVTRAVNLNLDEKEESFSYVLYRKFWKSDIEKKSRFLINFAGKPGSFKTYSFSDVLDEKAKEEFKDKLVLIGATSSDLHDNAFVPVSYGKAMAGVEIHANIIQTLITKNFLAEQSKLSIFILIVIFSLIASLIFYKFRVLSIFVDILISLIYFFLSIKIFGFGVIMNLVYVPLSIFLVYGAETSYLYLDEKNRKEEIKNIFSKYVSKEVVDEIIKEPEKVRLGGEKKNISILFSDIRGFTSISEKLSPEKLVYVLNEYLSKMTNVIMKNKGVVDKFIGDAIMAFWGAPLKEERHALLACNASLEMIDELKELNNKLRAEKFPELKIGIGLNTGEAVIGNIGSYNRANYTAMGDSINLGSRLEGLTKVYGVNIIISEFTKKAAGNEFATRKLDLVRVKGKEKAVEIYELVGRRGEVSEEEIKNIEIYEEALNLYLKKNFKLAIKKFEKAKDKASQELVERCKLFLKKVPGKNWDGVWVLEHK